MDINDIKKQLQSHFTDGLVVVVGSGLSCAEGLPGMAELASHLGSTTATLGKAQQDEWSLLAPIITKSGLEAALLANPPSAELESHIVLTTGTLMSERERLIVNDVFTNGRELRFSRLFKHLLKPTQGITVITTNYDRLIEVAAEEAGLGVDTMFIGQFAGQMNEKESRMSFCRDIAQKAGRAKLIYRSKVNVLKPHGSLDWYHRNGRPVRYSGELSVPRLIITPGFNKYRNGYDSPFDRHREKANLAIDQASRFLIIGYGFNDEHLETHLGPRIRAGVPTLLLTHTLSANAQAIISATKTVTAIEASVSGSSIYMASTKADYPNPIWDLRDFIKEVLEP